MLLNLSAWIRQQVWLKEIYRHFPQPWRNKLSEALASRASRQIKFRRTPNWERRTRSPGSTTGEAVRDGKFGPMAGINVFAYARGQSGLGESARLYIRALLAEGYPVAVHNIDLDIPHGMDDSSLDEHIGTDTPYGVNLIFVNPDYLENAIASIGHERLAGHHTIACWFWELEKFPEEWLPALQVVDEIMVSSTFIGKVISSVTNKPILHVPLPVGEINDNGLERSDFGLDARAFIFLNSFDFNSFLPRKNPLAVIEAFRRAFANDGANVQLLIKSSNGHRHPHKLRELLNAAAADQRILIRDEVIDRSDVHALQRCTDAYVSLHRAEGFGLGLAECMRLGKPVIATAWSGNMEFMTPANSCLVNYELVPVGEGEYLHHEGQSWAEPDIDHAAMYMQRLVQDRALATKIGSQAASDIRDMLSPNTAAQRIIQRLCALSSKVNVSHSVNIAPATNLK
ncbi:MAG: glycosyltransferase [Rhodanobacter sp.]|jgi:glycosyltransferase involved in cell wall biosynthesis